MNNVTRFVLADLPVDHPIELISRRRIVGQNVMLSEVILETGCDVPVHQHPNEQMAIVLSGRIRFSLPDPDGHARTVVLGPGEVLLIPPNVPHGAFAEARCRILDIFSPPSETTGVDRAQA